MINEQGSPHVAPSVGTPQSAESCALLRASRSRHCGALVGESPGQLLGGWKQETPNVLGDTQQEGILGQEVLPRKSIEFRPVGSKTYSEEQKLKLSRPSVDVATHQPREHSTFSSITKVSTAGRPSTPQSTPASSRTSLQQMSATTQMPQTWSVGTRGGSETMSSVSSQATYSFSALTPPPLLSTPKGHTSPQTEPHALSPSHTSKTLISTAFGDSHQSHTTMATLSPGTTGGPPAVGSTTLRPVASHSPATVLPTSGEVPTSSTSSATEDNMAAVVIPPVHSGSVSLTNTTHVPASSVGLSSTPSFQHLATTQRVASTTSPRMRSSSVIPTNTPSSAESPTLTVAGGSTSHPLSRTAPVTSSETSTSQPMVAQAFTHTHIPTFAASPSGHPDPATQLQSTATSPVATQATATDISATAASATTFGISATAGPTRQPTPTPLLGTTSPPESSTVFHIGHTQATRATQESQTTRLVSPTTDTVKRVTTTAASFIPSGYSPSGSLPQDAPITGKVTTFTHAPSGGGHTTQAATTGLSAAPSSPGASRQPLGGTSPSVTGTIPRVTTGASASGGPAAKSTLPSASTSAHVTPAIGQTHRTQGTETSGETHTSKQASSMSHTISAGTATPASSTAGGRTTSGSVSSATSTSGRITSFSQTPSSHSQAAQGTTEFLSPSTSPDTGPGAMGMVSVVVPSTFSSITKVPTAGRPSTPQSTPASSRTSLQQMSATTQMPQTWSVGTLGGSETMSSVSSQATYSFSALTPPPLLSTPKGHTSPQTEPHALSPSHTSKTLISTAFGDSHQSHTTMATLSPGTTGGPPAVGSTTLRPVASHSPATVLPTSGEVPTSSTSSATEDNMAAVVIPPVHSGSVSLTNTTHVPASSVGLSSTPSFQHLATTQRVASTTSPRMRSSSVIPTNTPSSAESPTLTVAGGSTSHPLSRTAPVTSSETSTSQPMVAQAFTHTHIPTFAASPSGHPDPATQLQSTATSPVATQATATDISATAASATTFGISATAGPTRQPTPTPLLGTTSPPESSTVFHIGHTQATRATQESQTTRLVSPTTDTVKRVTTTAASFIPSGYSPSGSLPQDAPITGKVTTFTHAPSGGGHTTQAATTGLSAAPSSPGASRQPLGGTSPSVTGTIPRVTTGASASGGPAAKSTLPSASTSAHVTPAIGQTHRTQGTETSGETHTSKQASSMSHTISAGTATPASSTAGGRTTSGSVSSATSTSGRITSFSQTPSSHSQAAQGTTEFLSPSTSPDTGPGAMGMVSVVVPSTFSSITKVPTAGRPSTPQSTPASSRTSLEQMSATTQMPQTWSVGTRGGSETMSSVSSQATYSFSALTPPPLLSTPKGHTSPQTEPHALSPSHTSKTLISTAFGDSHQSHTTMATLSPGTTGGPPAVGSTTLRPVASHSPATVLPTSGEVPTSSTSSATEDNMAAVVIPPVHSGSVSLTNTTHVPASSVGLSSTPSFQHLATTQRVASTTSPRMRSSSVIPTNTPSSAESPTLTVAGGSTSHPLSRTAPVTSSETSTSQPMVAQAFTHTHIPTFAASPSGHPDPATQLQSTATSPVATQATATDISATAASATTFGISATAGPTRQPTPTPLLGTTSPPESSTVFHIGHTQATRATQESQTTRLVSPTTDTVKRVTTTAASFIPSGYSPSGSLPQDAPITGKVTTFTHAPSGGGHTTQAATTGLSAAPSSPGASRQPLGGTSPSVTGTIPRVTTGASASGGPAAKSTLPSASTSAHVTPAIGQTHRTQGTETSGETHTSKQASSMSHTISAGTATPASSTAGGRTTSGSVSSATSTSGRITSFSQTPSSHSQAAQGTTEFLSPSTSPDTGPGAMGMVSVVVPSTFSSITKVPTAGRPSTPQSTPASSRTSLEQMSATTQMPQTWSVGTRGGSETMSSVSSQATYSFSALTPPPLLSTPKGHTSPQTEPHALSPSHTSKTLISTAFGDSHQSHTTMATLSPGTTGGPPAVGSTTLRPVASHSPATVLPTSGEVPTSSTSSATEDNMAAVVIPPVHSGSVSLTNTTHVPASSVGLSSTPSFQHLATTQRVASTTSPRMRSSSVIPTNTPSSAESPTLTVAGGSTSHPLSRTAPVTSSETSTSQPMVAQAFTHTHIPTFAASPSGHPDPATQLQSTATSPVATQATATDISATAASATTFGISATAGPTRQPTPTPLLGTTSPPESSTVFHIGHTQATRATQESQTTRLVSPTTDTVKRVTTTAASFIPSGYSPSGSLPQDAPITGKVTTFTHAPSGGSHTTQAATTGLSAAPSSPGASRQPLGGTSPSVTGTIPRVTTGASASGGPAAKSTLPSASTSAHVTPAIGQTHRTQGTETSGETHTSKQASSMSHTISAGTATPASSTAGGRTTSGSVSSATSTSGRITSFSQTPSSHSQAAQGTTEFLSPSTSPDTGPGAMGMVSVVVPSTFSSITKVPTAGRPSTPQSTPASSRTSLEQMSATTQMPQTWSVGTRGGSETMSSVSSQATYSFSALTPPPLLSTPKGHTSPQTEPHALSPSHTSKTLISTAFGDSHQSHTTMATLSPGTTGGPPAVGSTTLRPVASHSPATVLPTSGEVPTSSTSSATEDNMAAVVIPPVHSGSVSLTNTTHVPASSVGLSSTPSFQHLATTQRVASTTSPRMRSSSVIPTNTPSSAESPTLTVAGGSTSHPLSRTAPVTSSETSTSQPMVAQAFTHTHIPTFAASPSGHPDPATQLQSTATSPVATQATATDISATAASATTFGISATAGPTRQPTPTPLLGTTSPPESSTVFHIGHTQATRATQESQTTRLVSPTTDTVKRVTTTAASFIPSGYSPSGSLPQDAPITGKVTTFTHAPSGGSHTTQAATTGLSAAPSSPGASRQPLGGTSPSVTGTIPRVTTGASASGGPAAKSTLPSASTSAHVTPAIGQTHRTQGTETSGETHTSKQASSMSHTISAGTATPASSTAGGRTTSGSVSSATSTSGRITSFSQTPSSHSQAAQGTTEFLSPSTSPDTGPGAMGMVSVVVPSTFSSITKVPTAGRPSTPQSTPASSRTSLEQMSATTQMPQTWSVGTRGGSETMSSVSSQATYSFSALTPPPLLSTPKGHTSPQTEPHALSPSHTSKTLISTAFGDSHQSHTTMATLSPGTTGGPPAVGSTTLRPVASHSPATVLPTSGEVPTSSTSSATEDNMAAVVIAPVHSGSVSLTNTTHVPASSVGLSSTPSFQHLATTQRVASTTSPRMRSSSVIPTNTPSSAESPTLTVAVYSHQPCRHPSNRNRHLGNCC
ncbi:uncharacterized protein LOC142869560 [Microcebus murinus]|uniref:uncharacterized protein LOC142869560 n=1 Tax=Microcebus murinus TaxID=30608 RepID=UPI003F6A9B32